jgi:hypothetical protein
MGGSREQVSVRVLLIHGVGEHSVTHLRAGVAAQLATEADRLTISGLDGNTKVAVPITRSGTLSLGYLAPLVRAIRATAKRSIAQRGTSDSSPIIDATSSILDGGMLQKLAQGLLLARQSIRFDTSKLSSESVPARRTDVPS